MLNTTIGKYRLLRLLGEGGMASVYEAEHELLGTRAAIKVLNPILSANPQIRERFRNEARLMASLDHPNITRVLDFDEDPRHLSIVMEFLQGQDLNRKIRQEGPLPEKELQAVFSQILSAFQYAHEKGVVHRDIKPSNIFLLPNGQVKILDFGIAKLFGQQNELTQTGTQIGTPVYMSPEQVRADKTIDHRSDIYSLGVTLYFAISGKPPYDAETDSQFDIFNKIVFEPLPGLPASHPYSVFVNKACDKNRDQRFQNCGEWLQAWSKGPSAMPAPPRDSEKTMVETPAPAPTPAAEKTRVDRPAAPVPPAAPRAKEPATPASPSAPKSKKPLVWGLVAVAVLVAAGLLLMNKKEKSYEEPKPMEVDTPVTNGGSAPAPARDTTLTGSMQAAITAQESPLSPAEQMLLGTRVFGTHWIEPYGRAEITRENGQLMIRGQQRKGDDYCTISGVITVVDDRNFRFNGSISLRHHTTRYVQGSSSFEPAIDEKTLTGEYLFRRTGSRQYWRLKQPDSPTGYFNYSYHYIDIFL